MIVFRKQELINHSRLADGVIALRVDETRHLKALRLRSGDELELGDGDGRVQVAEILSPNEIRLTGEVSIERAPFLPRLLAVSIPEGRRWDWLLQKAAELGVTHILPLDSERSQRRRLQRERAERILELACSQSRNLYLPKLYEPQRLSEVFQSQAWQDWISQSGNTKDFSEKNVIYLLSPMAAEMLAPETRQAIAFFIGPEGGFSPFEEGFLLSNKAIARNLGPRILRIETAALSALARSI